MVLDMLKKAWLLPLSWLIAMSASASTAAPLKIANVIIPASFAKALEEGLAVPVRLRYTDEDNRIDTLTDDTIGNATRGREPMPLDRIVDMAVSRLRQRLRDTEKPPRLIRTVRGSGYLLAASVAPAH